MYYLVEEVFTMQDIDKSKEQLATEVVQLRQRIVQLEQTVIERKQVEEKLRESEERYRHIFEKSPIGIGISSLDGNVVTCNKAMEAISGYSVEEFKNINLADTYEVRTDREGLLEAIRRDGGVVDFPIRLRRQNGTVYDSLLNISRINLGGKEFVQTICQDITDRKQAEAALRESEARYHSLFENSQDAILLTSPDGSIFDVNPAACQMFSRTAEEIKQIGRNGLVDVTDMRLHAALEERNRLGKARAEITMIRADGTRFPVDISSTIFTEEHGQLRTSMIIRDITERKQIEEALRESEDRYRTLIDNIALGINLIDADHNILMVNASMGEKFNKPVSEMIGKKCFRELEKRDAVCLHCPGVRTMTTGRPVEVETEGVRDDGSHFHVRLRTFPVFGKDRSAVAFIEIAEDITERKQAEEALQESEEKYRSLVESSEDSIYLVDKDCTYLFMNKKHLSRLGLKRSQVIGRAYVEFHSPEETQDFAQRVEKVLKTGKAHSYEYRSQRDNRYFIRTLSPVKPLEVGKPAVITVISKDITQLKQAEEVLRRHEQEIRMIADNVPALVSYVDAAGCYRFVNRQYEEWFGLPRTEIIGKRCSQVLGDPAFELIKGRIETALAGHRVSFEEALPYAHGSTRWVIADYVPDADDEGRVNGFFALVTDITERKRTEELLQRERDTFFSILQKAPYGAVFLDEDGVSIFINTEFTAITGYTLKDVSTLKNWFRLAYPDKTYRDMVINTLRGDVTQDSNDKIFQKTFHRTFFRTFRVTCKDGTIKEIEFRPTVLEDGCTIVMIADITERKRMHELLELAVTEWRTTFDAISDAVCLLDREGRIKRCNNAMMKVIGKPFSEIVDRTCWEVFHGISTPPQGCPLVSVEETHQRETEVFLKDNRWLNISVDPLHDEEGNFLGAVHITSDITERIQSEEELHSSHEQLRNLAVYLESVREQERTKIAREIHDELAQDLTALKMDLSWLENRLPRDQMQLGVKTRSMGGLIDTIIQTVKRISAELRPGVLDDLGLVAAIEWQADEFQERTGITCRVTVDPVDLTVEKDRSTAIFRIFQETLTNIARHAGASRITVKIKKKARTLTLRVTDNGAGITDEQINDSKSFGLIGMRERVHPWGGQVRIKGTPGEGTSVEVEVPVVND
jgi:PAS domain S-box-containing protein